jgi:hypothetical protein
MELVYKSKEMVPLCIITVVAQHSTTYQTPIKTITLRRIFGAKRDEITGGRSFVTCTLRQSYLK